ncbi:MAG: hypothetical protein KIS67_13775 [Verrucomicrobiae bacterium]|nr:hypothetical protein [Verrucomicrobiae bacterium]
MKPKLQTVPLIALVLAAAMMPHAFMAQEANTPLETTKVVYAFTNWVGQTRSGYLSSVINWTPDFAATGFTNVIAKMKPDKQTVYMLHREAADSVTVRVVECDTVRSAHEGLVELLSNCSAPQPLPDGKLAGLDIGDKCYVGYPTNAPLGVLFVRNNLLIRIDTVQSNINIPSIARALDNQVKTRSGQR